MFSESDISVRAIPACLRITDLFRGVASKITSPYFIAEPRLLYLCIVSRLTGKLSIVKYNSTGARGTRGHGPGLKNYIAFKRLKNFACLEVYPQTRVITVYLKVDPKTAVLEEGFSRDVTKIGHFGTGDLELSLRALEDFARAQPLLQRSYEGS